MSQHKDGSNSATTAPEQAEGSTAAEATRIRARRTFTSAISALALVMVPFLYLCALSGTNAEKERTAAEFIQALIDEQYAVAFRRLTAEASERLGGTALLFELAARHTVAASALQISDDGFELAAESPFRWSIPRRAMVRLALTEPREDLLAKVDGWLHPPDLERAPFEVAVVRSGNAWRVDGATIRGSALELPEFRREPLTRLSEPAPVKLESLRLLELAQQFDEAGEGERALVCYQWAFRRALEPHPQKDQAARALADAYLSRGDESAAAAVLAMARRRDHERQTSEGDEDHGIP